MDVYLDRSHRVRRARWDPSTTALLDRLPAEQVVEVQHDLECGLKQRRNVASTIVRRLQDTAGKCGVVYTPHETNRLTKKVLDLLEEQHPLVRVMIERPHS